MDSRRRILVIEVATVVALSLLLFFYGLGNFGLVGADEPRYAQVAREMLHNNDYVTPTLHGTPWLEKPALYYWRAAAAFRTFGDHDWAARLPSATFATALVIIIYFHMRRFRPGAQFGAALITATAVAVIGFSRGASTDMQLAAPFAFAMLGWYAWFETGKKFWLFDLYFFLAVGTLAKGPVAPGLAFFIVLIFAVVRRDLKLVWKTVWLPGVLIYSVIVLPWYIAVQMANKDFFKVFFLEHNLERFATDLFQHKQPFWFYLPVLLLSLLPWTAYALAALASAAKQTWRDWRSSFPGRVRESEQVGDSFPEFLVIWALFPILFFSFSQSKLPGYILPSIPPCTILTADYLRRRTRAAMRPALLLGHSLITALLTTAVLLVPHLVLDPKSVPPTAALSYASVVGAAVFCFIFLLVRRRGARMLLWTTIVPVAFGVFFLLHYAGRILGEAYSSRQVAGYIQGIERDNLLTRIRPVAVLDTRRDVEYGLGFYLDQRIERYERGEVPTVDHILVARAGQHDRIEKLIGSNRKFISFGSPFPGSANPQHLEVLWISSSGSLSR
ncbi:MAG TPA: glycosyltransferase family 39 protein [Terriglobales bacterium]|jgi:4-amino-4-deoxy-L-arabinose transferase-like glycosyltransferase|nr:glycosyltransferase family 39 protein [Terriglobales bacterium]